MKLHCFASHNIYIHGNRSPIWSLVSHAKFRTLMLDWTICVTWHCVSRISTLVGHYQWKAIIIIKLNIWLSENSSIMDSTWSVLQTHLQYERTLKSEDKKNFPQPYFFFCSLSVQNRDSDVHFHDLQILDGLQLFIIISYYYRYYSLEYYDKNFVEKYGIALISPKENIPQTHSNNKKKPCNIHLYMYIVCKGVTKFWKR